MLQPSTPLARLARRAAWLVAAALALALLLPAAQPATAGVIPTVITITKTQIENDDGNGCSLYEALQAIFNGAPYHQCNAGPDANAIVFTGAAAGGTITMPTGPGSLDLPMITKNVTITGPVTISGGGSAGDLHIFRIGPNGTLNLFSLTLKDAHTSGGGAAILDNNFGTINALGVSFENNVADGDGGAINSNGSVNIATSNFVGNKAQGVANGGNNPATGYGGAINMSGSDKLKVALSNFSGNLADKGGGAIYTSNKAAELSDVIFSGNIVNGTGTSNAAPQGGGAVMNAGSATLSVIRTAFNGNLTPTSNGGALLNQISATSTISETAFNGNISGAPSVTTQGGAIYNQGGTIDIVQTTMLNNAVADGDGGAIANDRHGTITIANSSFTANAALQGNGGALNNVNTQQGGPASSVTARNVTFSANAAINSTGHGGAIFNGQGHSVTLGNTIVDGSVGDNCTGTISSLGHNLDSANTCGFSQAGDKHDQPAQLDAPFFNGGPLVSLLTQKLKPGSPAIDAGDPAICSAAPVGNIDQRGEQRPKDGDSQPGAVCDMGSFESDALVAGYGSTPVQPGPIDFGNSVVNPGTPLVANLSIFETGNAALIVSNPTFGGSNPGDFGVKAPSPFPLTLNDGDSPVGVQLTCAPTAVGARSATLTLNTNDPSHPSVTYNLTCSGTAAPVAGYGSAPAAPGPISFGDVNMGSSATTSFQIQETGNAALQVSAPVFGGVNPGDFAVKAPSPFPLTINDGAAAQTVQITCAPAALGIRTATLTLTTNDPSKPTVSYNLACNSVPVPPPYLDAPGFSYNNNLVPGNVGPYGVAVSPDGKNVYAADKGDNLVTVFGRNPANGHLVFQNGQVNGSGGVSGMASPYLVTVSPDGKNVYVTGSASDAVVSFQRDTNTGALTFLSKVAKGDGYFCLPNCQIFPNLTTPYQVLISPDGQYGYISDIGDSKIVVLDRNSTTGALGLGFTGAVQVYGSANITQAYGMALSPDGAYLYITGYQSDTVEVLKRDASTGKLTFVEKQANGVNGVDGLNGVFRATVSPDGGYLYTASYDDSAVTAFRRDASTGKLTYLTRYKDGVGGIDGIASCTAVAISPDGTHLYATGFTGKAVTVFERDPLTGLLTQRQVIKRNPFSGAGGVPALDGARDVVASADGQNIYATGFNDNQVVELDVANPVPAATSLAPSSAQAGAAAFTLTVNGEGFIPGSAIYWGGAALPTTFVNNTKLTASVAAAKVAAAGTATIQVVSPTPGGGGSNQLTFTITAPGQNPVPSIDTLAPASAPAGGAAFTLTVNGSNFIAGSKVRWNGADRTTTFVSSTKLTAQIGAADIAQGGSAGVAVFTPGPGGGLSNAVEFTIADPGENPTPSIAGVSPSETLTDLTSAKQLTIDIDGANFMADSVAQWNGDSRPTTFLSSTKLRMTITVADLALGGQGSITVANPAPGGGGSNTATFTIHTIVSRVSLPMILR
jgi:predicted outer membrane repeat protein